MDACNRYVDSKLLISGRRLQDAYFWTATPGCLFLDGGSRMLISGWQNFDEKKIQIFES